MMPAAKHFDPVVGVDIHIILIPTPAGPVPTPIPHPFIGMVIDPMDYVPIIGATVFLHGLPIAVAGTAASNIPPHIPIGGPFSKPPGNEGEMFMGSSTVNIGGEPVSYMALPVLSCQDIGIPAPFRPGKSKKTTSMVLPLSVVLPIPTGPPLLIGGAPTISLMALGMRVGMAALGKAFKKLRKMQKSSDKWKKLSDKLNDIADNFCRKHKIGDVGRNRMRKAICTVTGHPVDVATGKVFTEKVDFELPGVIPFRWERTWYSTSTYRGPLGHGWHHSYDIGIHVEEDLCLLRMADGRFVAFPPLAKGEEYFNRSERVTFFRDDEGYGLITTNKERYRFKPRPRVAGEQAISSISDRSGLASITFEYDAHGRLIEAIDTGGRSLQFAYGKEGRILAVSAPHPDEEGQRVDLVRYGYDDHGDLVRVHDALEQTATFEYRGHLLTKETDRNGLSFYFEYDGVGPTAKCIHTWGDGGIYDHKLSYDDELGITVVENSLGYRTQFAHQGGLVTKIVDPTGATTLMKYDELNQLVAETDALGQLTQYAYDERGNRVLVANPDGSRTETVFDDNDNPVSFQDQMGSISQWTYDEHGQMRERIDALGNKTQYVYRGGLLEAVVDAAGEVANCEYDDMGNLQGVSMPNGARFSWKYDQLGRATCETDPIGSSVSRSYDLLGRVIEINAPDGCRHELRYDAENKLVHATDGEREVRLTYGGMGKLVSRAENGTTVRFEYDSEEQLLGVHNEYGRVYGFDLGPTGEVMVETNFGGLRRSYVRDSLGRIVTINRPGNRSTHFEYDAMDRITKVRHSDDSAETFEYRADGELVRASNSVISVSFEWDELGRMVKESQGDYWVESEYDAMGRRMQLRSSLGICQTIERDAMGNVTAIGGDVQARIERDLLGRELVRHLPGGIRAQWSRDRIGRPIRHEVRGSAESLRAVEYKWGANDRLVQLVDQRRGQTQFGHDGMGNLAWAEYSNGVEEFRMPDAVGNLFKSKERSDRKYGPSGELLEAMDSSGLKTRYEYDDEGNLVRKIESGNRTWAYHWNLSGLLVRVDRPDGRRVWFSYDALGRRVSKTYGGKTTHWVWDGNNPLHEWVQDSVQELLDSAWDQIERTDNEGEPGIDLHPGNGPPEWRSPLLQAERKSTQTRQAVVESAVTWLFDPDEFSPLARLNGGRVESIVTDHIGTPVAMTDSHGSVTWSLQLDTYGAVHGSGVGERQRCPFRFPGQYEDEETGLYYNRFRYYDSTSGSYLSLDPLDLGAGLRLMGYVRDPLIGTDPLGLNGGNVSTGAGRDHVTYRGTKNGKPYTGYASAPSSAGLSADEIVSRRYGGNFDNFGGNPPQVVYEGTGVTGKETARGLEQHYYEQDVKTHTKAGVANRQNPVGVNNKKAGKYRSAASKHLKGCK